MLTHQPAGPGGALPRQSGDPDYIVGGYVRAGLGVNDDLDPGDDDDDEDDDEDDDFWADELLGEIG
jgi:hypothetical protein